MGRIITIPIDTGFYITDDTVLSAEDCVNLYPVTPTNKGASSSGALYRIPGISLVTIQATGVGRGLYRLPETQDLLSCSGNNLYLHQSTYNSINKGTITGSGRVIFASNGITTCIVVPGITAYFYRNGILTEIDDPIFDDFKLQVGGVTSVTTKDSRFIYTTDVEFFMGSPASVNFGESFDALDFEDAEVTADKIVRAFTLKNELYIFGGDNIEIYQSIATTAFPLTRILGATINKGLIARHSLVEFDANYLFLGKSYNESPAIWSGFGTQVIKVSSDAIDTLIQRYSEAELADVSSWTYTQDGSRFVGFTFPNETLVFDATASRLQKTLVWHQRKSNGTHWRVDDIATVFGDIVCSDNIDARLGLLSRNIYSEYDEPITRSFVSLYVIDQTVPFRISSVELVVSPGTGNPIPDLEGTDPVIEMLFSKDGGNIFIPMGNRKIGQDNQFGKKTIWNRIGRVPTSIIFKFVLSEKVSTDFFRLILDIN